MNQRQMEKWAVTRAKGRRRYIWLFGVAFWGLFTGILWSVAMGALEGWDHLPILLPLALILFPVGGYFVGAWTWNRAEDEFQKTVSKPPSP
jgi:hypothetical protein